MGNTVLVETQIDNHKIIFAIDESQAHGNHQIANTQRGFDNLIPSIKETLQGVSRLFNDTFSSSVFTPKEITVEFAIGIEGEVGVIFSKYSTSATFAITATWEFK